jgi:hypothetical protein
MVGVDSSFLSIMLHPGTKPPRDLAGKLVERMQDRIDRLIEDLDVDAERIILPTPALSEFLILAGKQASEYLDKISEMKTFLIKPFDERAAIELAAIELDIRSKGDKKGGSKDVWQKVKIDRQIVVISKINGAKRIFSEDPGLNTFATSLGIEAVSSWQLPLPAAKQEKLFTEREEEQTSSTRSLLAKRSIRLEDEVEPQADAKAEASPPSDKTSGDK